METPLDNLLDTALHHPDAAERQHARAQLVATGADAVPTLIMALRQGYHPAATIMGKIGNAAVEPLLVLLTDEQAEAREAAAIALRYVVDPRSVEPLIVALKDEECRCAMPR